MTKAEYLEAIDLIDKHRLLANSHIFDIEVGDIDKSRLTNILKVLDECEKSGVLIYKQYLKHSMKMLGILPSFGYIEAISISLDMHGYNNFVTEIKLRDATLSYKYALNVIRLFIDGDEVGTVSINAETTPYYDYALKNPGEIIDYNKVSTDSAKKTNKSFIKNYNTNPYYSSVLKHLFVLRTVNYIKIATQVQISEEIEATIRSKLSK